MMILEPNDDVNHVFCLLGVFYCFHKAADPEIDSQYPEDDGVHFPNSNYTTNLDLRTLRLDCVLRLQITRIKQRLENESGSGTRTHKPCTFIDRLTLTHC